MAAKSIRELPIWGKKVSAPRRFAEGALLVSKYFLELGLGLAANFDIRISPHATSRDIFMFSPLLFSLARQGLCHNTNTLKLFCKVAFDQNRLVPCESNVDESFVS
jgi:hypothetical protein